MSVTHDTDLAGEWRSPVNTAASQKGSIHDDTVAQGLGFKGGTVAGSLHMDQFAPLLHRLYGEAWASRGNLSLYFRQATVGGEKVRAFARPGHPQARLWMENEAGALINEGTASADRPAEDTELRRRLSGQARAAPGALRILGSVREGSEVRNIPGRIGADALALRLKTIPERIVEYDAAPARLPPSLAVHLYRAAQTSLLPLAGPAVGLFGAIELQALGRPLLAETDYLCRAKVLALSESPKTENVWFQAFAADPASGGDVGWMIMYLRFMKASSPLWR